MTMMMMVVMMMMMMMMMLMMMMMMLMMLMLMMIMMQAASGIAMGVLPRSLGSVAGQAVQAEAYVWLRVGWRGSHASTVRQGRVCRAYHVLRAEDQSDGAQGR